MFLGLYMSSLLLFIYIPNRKKLFLYPRGEFKPVSIIVPCFNEGKTIGTTIESLLSLDYPKEMVEVIVVDDQSKDDSVKIARQYEKKYKNVRVFVNKRNSGGAAEPTNIGIRASKYEYVAVVDSDSMPDRDVLKKMIGFLFRAR
jgi:cellulose synthase/poly-beta-1,6-N-acetylglucosamine synthase-like glycosyltransferase